MEMAKMFGMIGAAALLVGIFAFSYQVYKLVVIDAETRGLKHPKFWGIFSLGGNQSGGLLLYLIGRRKYPVLNKTEAQKKEMIACRKKSLVGLVFLSVGAIILVSALVFL